MGQSKRDRKTERAVAAYRGLVGAIRFMNQLLDRQLYNFGLTTTQFGILEALLEEGPMSQVEIADSLWCSDSTVNVCARNLAKRGLVVRRASPRDRREIMTHLTPEGRQLVAKVSPGHAKVVRAQMSALTYGQQDTLRRLCQKLEKGDPRGFILEITSVDDDEG